MKELKEYELAEYKKKEQIIILTSFVYIFIDFSY